MPKLTKLKQTVILFCCALAICSLSVSSATVESSTPATDTMMQMPTFSVDYILENDFVTAGEAVFKLARQADHYQLLLETKPTGMFRFSKKGKIREIAELPSLTAPFLSSKYTYTNFGDKDRSYTSTYNRQTGEAIIARNGNTKNVAMDKDAVDRLSMTLAIMQQLREQPHIESFSVNAIDTNGVEAFHFVSRGQEQLQTDIGNFTTTRVERKRSDRNTITWFATIGPDEIPMPVQIEQYKRGKLTVRLRITRFSGE